MGESVMLRRIIAAIGLTSFLLAASHAQAGGCFSQRVVTRQLISAPLVTPVSYSYYFVGAPIREQAILQRSILQQSQAVESDQLYQEFLEFKRWKEGQQLTQAERLSITAPANATVVATVCLKCHSGPEPKGDTSFEGPLSDHLKLKMMQMVWSGRMPPTAPLDNEKAARLFEELLGHPEETPAVPDGSLPLTVPPPAPPAEESVETPTPEPPIQP